MVRSGQICSVCPKDRQQDIECERGGSKICTSGRAETPEEGTGATGLGESQSFHFVPDYLLPHSKPLLSSHAFLFGVWKEWTSNGQGQAGAEGCISQGKAGCSSASYHSFIECMRIKHAHVSGTVLGSGNTAVNGTALMGLTFWWGGQIITTTKNNKTTTT